MVTERGAKRVDFTDGVAGKERVLQAIQAEADGFFRVAAGVDEAGWHAASPCEGWEVRDLVGHMVDTSQTYLGRYVMALEDYPAPPAIGMDTYSKAINEAALALRPVPQFELIGRLRGTYDRLMEIWQGLTPEQWAGLQVHHKYAGPVPQFMMVMFQLLDYAFHTWDMRVALGQEAHMTDEAAGILTALMPTIMQLSFAGDRAPDQEITLGFDVDGPYGGSWKGTIQGGQLSMAEGDLAGAQAVIRYADAETFCLEHYGRATTGAVDGDQAVVERFRSLFNYL